MARPCSVCVHPRRRDIDAALISGEALRTVGGRFSIAKSTLSDHVRHIQTAATTAPPEPVLDIAMQVRAINGVALRWLANGEARVQLQACRVVQAQLEFVHALETEALTQELLARVEALEQAHDQESRQAIWPHVA
jgi:hypothetical protein